MTESTTDHICRAGDNCQGRQRDSEDRKVWIPAATTVANTLCDSCINSVEQAVSTLWGHYMRLHHILGEMGTVQHSAGKHPSPSPTVPINVHYDALMVEIVRTVDRCAEQVADVLHMSNPEHERPTALLAAGLAIIEPNIRVLAQVGRFDALEWKKGGEEYDTVELDGPILCMKLLDLRRRARACVGELQGRDRMPVPCPRCEYCELGRWHGSEVINCNSCGSTWTNDDYRHMTMILADDYKELAG
ncbi:hypothetical protein [Rhodococcus sp. JVH1]|uniref:hypothetical protein n=1 Tax=Rhodococcus sp. JVH1 TaxID=745408 RepID=UPI00027207F2|nr:hypothetical protein [Rhodococcus sp. JVH1]EJJ01023.1 hypothetical protein JVH1_1649 [Rhodococcus sp. JVH1]